MSIKKQVVLGACSILILLFVVPSFTYSQNTFYGTGAGNAGSNNTSFGAYAGDVVTGASNSFFGWKAGSSTTSGYYNTFLGFMSGQYNTTGESNLFAGNESGLYNTSGSSNIFLGLKAGAFNTTGHCNIALGSHSYSANNGGGNVTIGHSSGGRTFSSSPMYNVMIGYESGKNSNSASYNVFLGCQAGYNETGSSKLYIDNSPTSVPLVYGNFEADQLGVNSLPNSSHTLTVGGTIHATGIYVNGQSITDAGFEFWTKAGGNIWNNFGNVGIGTNLSNNPKNYRLAVKGKFGAWEVEIENSSMTWSDFVFNDDYKLLSLYELEKYIKANRHLPEIPTEKEVREEGLKVSEMNAKLLQKIEELTLYVIELKKEVDTLKTKLNEKE